MAFAIYRNYDGKNSMFGDTALSSASGNQAQLSFYGAVRSSNKAITVMVINKTYGALTSTKKQVEQVLREFGWKNITDLGGIEQSRVMEAVCLLG